MTGHAGLPPAKGGREIELNPRRHIGRWDATVCSCQKLINFIQHLQQAGCNTLLMGMPHEKGALLHDCHQKAWNGGSECHRMRGNQEHNASHRLYACLGTTGNTSQKKQRRLTFRAADVLLMHKSLYWKARSMTVMETFSPSGLSEEEEEEEEGR